MVLAADHSIPTLVNKYKFHVLSKPIFAQTKMKIREVHPLCLRFNDLGDLGLTEIADHLHLLVQMSQNLITENRKKPQV